MFYVYILQSLKTGRLYVGHTDDIARRLEELLQEVRPQFWVAWPRCFSRGHVPALVNMAAPTAGRPCHPL